MSDIERAGILNQETIQKMGHAIEKQPLEVAALTERLREQVAQADIAEKRNEDFWPSIQRDVEQSMMSLALWAAGQQIDLLETDYETKADALTKQYDAKIEADETQLKNLRREAEAIRDALEKRVTITKTEVTDPLTGEVLEGQYRYTQSESGQQLTPQQEAEYRQRLAELEGGGTPDQFVGRIGFGPAGGFIEGQDYGAGLIAQTENRIGELTEERAGAVASLDTIERIDPYAILNEFARLFSRSEGLEPSDDSGGQPRPVDPMGSGYNITPFVIPEPASRGTGTLFGDIGD
jgi:hypothetical protein